MDSKTVEAAMRELRDMTIELRTWTKHQKEQIDELKGLVNRVVDSNNNQEGRIQKLEIIVENQNDMLKEHSKKIGQIEDDGKFNIFKFIKSQIPKIVTIGIVTTIVFILFSYSKFLPDIQELRYKINQIEQGKDEMK